MAKPKKSLRTQQRERRAARLWKLRSWATRRKKYGKAGHKKGAYKAAWVAIRRTRKAKRA